MESPLLAANSSGAGDEKAATAIRSGEVPPLADCFSTRPETVPGLADALVPGRLIILTGPETRRHQYDWPGGTGKTQLAVYLAEPASRRPRPSRCGRAAATPSCTRPGGAWTARG